MCDFGYSPAAVVETLLLISVLWMIIFRDAPIPDIYTAVMAENQYLPILSNIFNYPFNTIKNSYTADIFPTITHCITIISPNKYHMINLLPSWKTHTVC